MPEALTESFCERCGTRYEFKAPTRLNPLRKTRGLVSGLRNYIMSQDALSDAVGDAMRSEEESLAAQQLEAFHESFNFCIDCRQYTCINCWNHDAGRCRACAPIAGTDDLLERFEASFQAQHPDRVQSSAAIAEPSTNGAGLNGDAWPATDLPAATGNGHADLAWPEAELIGRSEAVAEPERDSHFVFAPPPALEPEPQSEPFEAAVEPEQEAVEAVEAAAQPVAEAEAQREPEWAQPVAEAEAEREPEWAQPVAEAEAQREPEWAQSVAEAEAEREPEWGQSVAEAEAEREPEWGQSVAEAEAQREPEWLPLAEPVEAIAEPEPEEPRVVAWEVDTSFELLPEEVVLEAAPETFHSEVVAQPEREVLADVEPESEFMAEAEPQPDAAEVEPQPAPEALAEAETEVPTVGEVDAEGLTIAAAEPELVTQAEPELVTQAEPELVAQAEPELVAQAEPEAEPELVAQAEPEAEPELVAQAEPSAGAERLPEPDAEHTGPTLRPIRDTILRLPRREPIPDEPRVAAEADDPAVAARRAQLDLLGLGDPGEGPVAPAPRTVLPYRSSGASASAGGQAAAARMAGGGSFWDASAREVASAMTQIGVQNCGQCGLSLSASARFCRRCGTRQARSA